MGMKEMEKAMEAERVGRERFQSCRLWVAEAKALCTLAVGVASVLLLHQLAA